MDLKGKILLDFTVDPDILEELGFDRDITRETYIAEISSEYNLMALDGYAEIIHDKNLRDAVGDEMERMGIGWE